MKIENLWSDLIPNPITIEILKKDLSEGKVPELPYFVVDQFEAKKAISDKLLYIDDDRMQTNLIIGQYGNGKTNLLKYLQLFFESKNYGITVVYSRVDVEKPDIVLFLLKLIQDNFTDLLIESIQKIKLENIEFSSLAHEFKVGFKAIEEYSKKLFSNDLTPEDIKKVIYLGTGRLYTKNHFLSYSLDQISDFNRREILVLFLNILSHNKIYIIFGLDEIEKIQEKSKLRFNQFLTSYRELIDFFNKIKGHYLITCFTDARGIFELESANPAFYSRIQNDIKELPPITSKTDIVTLISNLNNLLNTKKTSKHIEQISTQILKKPVQMNRILIRQICDYLNSEKYEDLATVSELISKYKLNIIFEETKLQLELEGLLKSLNQKFFFPLEYYLEDNFLMNNDKSEIDIRTNQSFNDELNGKTHLFLFNETLDRDTIIKKVNALYSKYQHPIIIYSPTKLELKNSEIKLSFPEAEFEIVDYDPVELFILLNMYKDNFNVKDKIGEIITISTKNNL